MFDILFEMYHIGLNESLLDYPMHQVIPVAQRLYLVRVERCSLRLKKSTLSVLSGSRITHVKISLIVGSLSKEKLIVYVRLDHYFFRGTIFLPSFWG